jgi:Cu(I)/Ag(I) efflux system membrane fusion protein
MFPRLIIGAALAAALLLSGFWLGAGGLPFVHARKPLAAIASGQESVAGRTVLYWKDPDGKADFSPAPTRTVDGRDYLPVYEEEEPALAGQDRGKPKGKGKILYYRNPMGLADTSPVPKKDSMGMDYIPVYEGDQDDSNAVKVSPGKLQRTGVRTELVSKVPIIQVIKAPGAVAFDEKRLSVVAMRFDGFINKVAPVTTGTQVKKGDPLMGVFGQDLLNASVQIIVEEVTGWRGPENAEATASAGRRDLRSRAVGARRRLDNLQVPPGVIEEIKRTRRVPDEIIWAAPQDGIVIERKAVDGQAFKAGDVLFRIADHAVVWVMVDVPEGDIAAVKPGQAASVRVRAYPGRVFNGTVAVMYPNLAKETRTARVRIELANPDLALLPDMYGDVEIATGSQEAVVTVPASAVIDSGHRQVVVLDLGEGRFEPKDVKLGRRGSGYVEILEGVQEGNRVVVDGNFLIDAESNLSSALKALTAPPKEMKP